MLDLDNVSVSEECAMMCTEVQYEDEDENEDVAVYGDQGINTEEYEKLHMVNEQKSKAKKRKKLSVIWPYAQMTMCHLKGKGGDLTKQHPMNTYMMLVRVTFH